MSKLLFEDDEGKTHEIKVSSVSKKTIKPDDIVLAYYEVGNAAPPEATVAITNLKIALEKIFESKVSVVAVRNGKKDIEISIVSKKE